MKPPLRILHLEDNPSDAELCQRLLRREGLTVEINTVNNAAGFQAALTRGGFDLILCDFSLPDYDGMRALAATRQVNPFVPFIFVSGELGEEAAIEALKSGATDYVLKLRMNRLLPAVRRAMAEAETRTERLRAEELARERDELLRAVMGSLSAHIAVVDAQGVILAVNQAWAKFGEENNASQPIRSGVGLNYLEICRQTGQRSTETARIAAGIEDVLRGNFPEFVFEYPCHSPAGQRWFVLFATPLSGSRGGAVLSHVDVTDRKFAELERLAMEQRLRQTERLVSLGELAASVMVELEKSSPQPDGPATIEPDPVKDFSVLLEHYEQLVQTVKVEAAPATLVPEADEERAQVDEQVMFNLCKLLAALADFKQADETTQGIPKDQIEFSQQDRLLAALQETVEVLEGTKRSFKSKPLGRLRAKLETLIRSQR